MLLTNITAFSSQIIKNKLIFDTRFSFFSGATAKLGPKPPHFSGLKITNRNNTPGKTSLNEWSARRRDLYLNPYRTNVENRVSS